MRGNCVRFNLSYEYYDHIAAVYDSMYQDKYWKSACEQIRRIVLRYVKNLHGLEVIDIGAGTGTWGLWFSQMGSYVTLVEPARNMLDIAKCKFGRSNLLQKVRGFFCTKIEDLENYQRYDIALLLGDVLSYVESPDLVIRKVAKLLKRHGLVFGTVDNYFSYLKNVIIYGTLDDLKRLQNLGKLPIGSEFGVFEARGFTEEELKKFLRLSGFYVAEITSLAVFTNAELNLKFGAHFNREAEHLLYVAVKE